VEVVTTPVEMEAKVAFHGTIIESDLREMDSGRQYYRMIWLVGSISVMRNYFMTCFPPKTTSSVQTGYLFSRDLKHSSFAAGEELWLLIIPLLLTPTRSIPSQSILTYYQLSILGANL
jgi:hypothetical protein